MRLGRLLRVLVAYLRAHPTPHERLRKTLVSEVEATLKAPDLEVMAETVLYLLAHRHTVARPGKVWDIVADKLRTAVASGRLMSDLVPASMRRELDPLTEAQLRIVLGEDA